MANNLSLMRKQLPMKGFLLPFEDHRATTTMHASITVPSSGNADYA